MTLEERESTEWTNTWISNANTHNRRCLLIGDSTTRQIRGSIEKMLSWAYSVDLFAASFSVNDSRLLDDLKFFFHNDEYEYDFMILHYGGHHNYIHTCWNNEKKYTEYYTNYEVILKYLMTKCNKIIIMTTNSKTLENNPYEIDEQKEKEIVARNKIVSEIAVKYGCKLFDLHGLMDSQKDVYKHRDPSHFTRDADYFTSYHILKYALEADVLNNDVISTQRNANKIRIMDVINNNDLLLIYGVGVIGKQIYWLLKWNGFEQFIKGFVVSDESACGNYDNKNICHIKNIGVEERKKCMLIVASESSESDMMKNGKELGFENILSCKNVMSVFEN
jgi:hypothetical protein